MFIVKTLNPCGTLDQFSANKLHDEVRKALKDGANIILVDFQEIELMKGCCLKILISILHSARSQEAELFICSLNDSVRIIFEITRMNLIFNLFHNRHECEEALRSRAA